MVVVEQTLVRPDYLLVKNQCILEMSMDLFVVSMMVLRIITVISLRMQVIHLLEIVEWIDLESVDQHLLRV